MEPNFVLHPPTHDADPPAWPHISCADGFAWWPAPPRGAPDRRGCIGPRTTARAALVAGVLQGRPIDRVLTLRRLLVGEVGERCPGVIVALWPAPCPACGRSHLKRADEWRRAALAIEPGAIEDLQRVDPPWRQLRNLDLPTERQHRLAHPRVESRGLPVRGTPEATLRAQELWSLEIAARTAEPYRPPRKRGRLARAEEGGRR